MNEWLASRLGYDPDRVRELPPRFKWALAAVSLASAPAVVLLAGSAAYGTWLASDVPWLSVAVGVGAGLYLWNLLRVAVAGGGVGPHQPFGNVTTFFPRTVPLVMLSFLGAFFAQPLMLGLFAREQDPQIDELRLKLIGMHAVAMTRPFVEERERAQAALDETSDRLATRQKLLDGRVADFAASREGRTTLEKAIAEDRQALEALKAEAARSREAIARADEGEAQVRAHEVAPYARHLQQSHFLLRRIQLTWERPARPAGLTVAMVLLMVLPWLASATFGRRAARAYEAGRWEANRALIEQAYKEAKRLELQALAQWASYDGPRVELFEDAPYNTRPRQGAGLYEARHG
ncbi:MAG: DUF4407 domain-containing protein [Myxococcaceae bacterium]